MRSAPYPCETHRRRIYILSCRPLPVWSSYLWPLLLAWMLLPASHCTAQENGDDTLSRKSSRHDIFNQAMEVIKRDPGDTLNRDDVLQAKSEHIFRKYEGRYIRHITISQLGFEKALSDTAHYLITMGTKIYNRLHVDTKDWVIRDNLFIRENTKVNPYEIADNERYLRTLDFIQDARILLKPVRGAPDSVDVVVITKDLFSLAGNFDINGTRRQKINLSDANFLGMGQRAQVTTLHDRLRSPNFGMELLYKKVNIAGTFLDATVAYSQINTGRSEGYEDEHAWYMRLDRPLVSPYSNLAGGFEWSRNYSLNVYRKPDSLFYDYRYHTFDIWGGYNIRIHQGNRDRKFIGLRYLRNNFDRLPEQVGTRFDPIYNSREAVLAQLTFFRQEFFKTNYIYGFGTTEDLPYGYKVSMTGGWYRQNQLERPYLGLDADRYIASARGAFYQLFLRTGGFYYRNSFQDAGLLVGMSSFSRLMEAGDYKWRNYLRIGYARLANRVTHESLRIDNILGIRYFSTDSVRGDQRFSGYTETVLFTPKKLFGFRLAPFVYANAVLLTPEKAAFSKSAFYSGIGGGMRVRNENLIFGTIELRVTYIPRTEYRVKGFRISLSTNLRFRYKNNYVDAPDIIRMNTSDYLH